jgi:hypothetical protein
MMAIERMHDMVEVITENDDLRVYRVHARAHAGDSPTGVEVTIDLLGEPTRKQWGDPLDEESKERQKALRLEFSLPWAFFEALAEAKLAAEESDTQREAYRLKERAKREAKKAAKLEAK